jgi:hypothetical protein
VVNERPEPTTRAVIVDAKRIDVTVRALGARILVVRRATGEVLASTR